jgi:CheY-like chemotaxis protein
VGRGTSVRLVLPSTEQPAPIADDLLSAQPAASDVREGSATILVVDDDGDVRAFLGAALEGLGHRMIEGADANQGLAMLARHEPDLLLLDYAMPGMNGADLACEVRRLKPDLPIIFVTGYAQSDQLDGALGTDAPVLRKPFTVAQLAAALAEHLAPKD